MTVFLLIRHGDTDYLGDRLAGRTPGVHLNQSGFQQAETLALSLAHLPIQVIYSSPMERTLETAQPIAKQLKIPIRIEQALNEVNYGSLQGKTFSQLKRLKIWKLVHAAPSRINFPEGESLPEVQIRASQALAAIADQFPGKKIIACFTHGDVIRLLLAHYLEMPLDNYARLFIQTAAISVVFIHEGKSSVLQVNHRSGQTVFLPTPL